MFNLKLVRRPFGDASESRCADNSPNAPQVRTPVLGGWILSTAFVLGALFSAVTIASAAPADQMHSSSPVRFGSVQVDGLNIAYREAGDPTSPKLVLLHGFPASSHQYRDLIQVLSDTFHVIAPDYPGFGNSDTPDPAK